MSELDCRNITHAKLPRRGDTAVPRNDLTARIDQNGIGKAKRADRCGDLSDLFLRMGPRVALVGREIVDRAIDDLEPERLRYKKRNSN